jgi:hypothetical protein
MSRAVDAAGAGVAAPAETTGAVSIKFGTTIKDVAVPAAATFGTLKFEVERLFDVPAEAQRLLVRGKECPDAELVANCVSTSRTKPSRIMLIKRANVNNKPTATARAPSGSVGKTSARGTQKGTGLTAGTAGAHREGSTKSDDPKCGSAPKQPLTQKVDSVTLIVAAPSVDGGAGGVHECESGKDEAGTEVPLAPTPGVDVACGCSPTDAVVSAPPGAVDDDAAAAATPPPPSAAVSTAEGSAQVEAHATRANSGDPAAVPFNLVVRNGQHAYILQCPGGVDTTFAAIQARLATHTGIPVRYHKLMCRGKVQPLEATLRDAGFRAVRAGDNNNDDDDDNHNLTLGSVARSGGEGSTRIGSGGRGGHGKATLLFRRDYYSSENILATLRADVERATALLSTATTVTRRLANRVTDTADVRAFVVTANEAVLVLRAHLDETAKSGVVLPRTSGSSCGGGGGGNRGTSREAFAPTGGGAADARATAITNASDELQKVRFALRT